MYMYMYMYMSYVLARHMAHAATLVSGVELLGTDSRVSVWLTPLVMTPWFSRLDFWVARVLN